MWSDQSLSDDETSPNKLVRSLWKDSSRMIGVPDDDPDEISSVELLKSIISGFVGLYS